MESCYQFEKQSVAEHGRSVAHHYLALIQFLSEGTPLKTEWKLPDWVHSPYIVKRQVPFQVALIYMVMHDCGKPFCRTVDEDGRQHFPDHARVSQEVFDHICSTGYIYSSDDQLVSKLIGQDMDAHMLKADGVPEFALRDEAPTLLLSALCELHSNAAMFGGIDSVGFKSKWKNLNRRGNALVKLWKEADK